MKTTKEELLKENARLTRRVETFERDDRDIRTQLTEILRYENGGMYSRPSPTMTWIQIAFHMGELRADANYSCLIQSREDLKKEVQELRERLSPKTDEP